MLATLTGDLCLLAGLAVLLLPLLATELSRPRDGAWGAVVLLLGLVLVTSSDRLRGAPMLGVACAGLLISRLGAEVGQARWQQLSDEERQRLGSRERWTTSLQQLTTVLGSLVNATTETLKSLKPASKTGTNKRWVRPEQPSIDADLGTSSPSGEASEASNDEDATAETPDTKKQRKKRWVRPDSSEPSLETQELSSTSSSHKSQGETKAEKSTDSIEDGSADNAIETASNTAASTTENTERTDED
ncbi:MAG: Ycf66 family protein [Synechococcus sp. cluster2_bin.235]|nr:Ycf66 family protein [Synechococcus sp. cluster2_bin.235]